MSWTRDQMAARAARELKDGYYVNLGIGIPTLIANHLAPGIHVTLQSENGMLGMGPYPTPDEVDPDLINAGKETVTQLPTSRFFSSANSFAMVGGPKLLRSCRLPLTGKACVDLVITDMGVFTVTRGQDALCLIELAPSVTVADIREATEADFDVSI